MVLLFVGAVIGTDLCLSPNFDEITAGLKQSVVPRGMANAGLFTRDSSATDMAKCVLSCCLAQDCEVIFQYFVNIAVSCLNSIIETMLESIKHII